MKDLNLVLASLLLVIVVMLLTTAPAAAQQTEPVNFDRTCTDAEDGDMSDTMVSSSDLQGELGQGGQFTADMVEGLHEITITCGPDSDGESPDPLVIAFTVAILNQPPTFGGAVGGGPGLPVDGGCAGTGCP